MAGRCARAIACAAASSWWSKRSLLAEGSVAAQPLPLEILHEDAALLVLNKPAGMVVHPGAGNREHTLQNALLAYDAALARVPRAGLVHRLDKDTSGVLVIARTPDSAHAAGAGAGCAPGRARISGAVCRRAHRRRQNR